MVKDEWDMDIYTIPNDIFKASPPPELVAAGTKHQTVVLFSSNILQVMSDDGANGRRLWSFVRRVWHSFLHSHLDIHSPRH